MPIISAELKLYKSAVVTNDSTNGGRMSANEIADAVKNNVFPDVTEAQRTAGFNDKRKVHFKVANDADLTATNVRNWIPDITPGGSRVNMIVGTATNTQGDLTGSERNYSVGRLNADVSAAATTIVVDAETGGGADLIFQADDLLFISDGTNEEFVTIDTGGVSWSTDQATITLTAGLLNAYTAAAPTTISSVIETATVETTLDAWVETSTSGTYDEGANPVVLDNIGTVEQTWTLTFSDATNFTVSGDTVGSVGAGTTGGDFAPNNTDFTKPYFTLASAGFAGTWANGETIVFATHAAAVDLWLLRDIPAGTGALASDNTAVEISVEG
jgi:hypothetical protein